MRVLSLMLALLLPGLALATPFSLPPLPYAADALESYVDTATMQVHHTGHHQAFVNNLNTLVPQHEELAGLDVETLLARASTLPRAIRNNAGGHYNHSVFWLNMAPAGTGGEPSAELLAAIERDLGGLDGLREQFNRSAATLFGSGWTWLVVTAEGRLKVGNTVNQDNPLMDDVELRGTPVLALDVWEHAYYLKHQNRRMAYIEAWWNVVNWNDANARYAAAMAP